LNSGRQLFPLKGIREQLNISERSLRRIFKFAKEKPLNRTKPRSC
jgi:hypothetical protein